MKIAMEVLSKFSDFYVQNKWLENRQIIVSEIEKIEENFYTLYESARVYLDLRKDYALSVISDTLSTDLHKGTNIQNHDDSETNRKKKTVKEQYISQWKLPEVGASD